MSKNNNKNGRICGFLVSPCMELYNIKKRCMDDLVAFKPGLFFSVFTRARWLVYIFFGWGNEAVKDDMLLMPIYTVQSKEN